MRDSAKRLPFFFCFLQKYTLLGCIISEIFRVGRATLVAVNSCDHDGVVKNINSERSQVLLLLSLTEVEGGRGSEKLNKN